MRNWNKQKIDQQCRAIENRPCDVWLFVIMRANIACMCLCVNRRVIDHSYGENETSVKYRPKNENKILCADDEQTEQNVMHTHTRTHTRTPVSTLRRNSSVCMLCVLVFLSLLQFLFESSGWSTHTDTSSLILLCMCACEFVYML